MKPEHPILFDPEPDPLEQKVRAVCGVLLGLLVAFGLWAKLGPFATLTTVLVVVASIVVCAYGAVRYGDQFWYGFFRSLRGLV